MQKSNFVVGAFEIEKKGKQSKPVVASAPPTCFFHLLTIDLRDRQTGRQPCMLYYYSGHFHPNNVVK